MPSKPCYIQYSLFTCTALRITRICSEPETRDLRHSELRELLLERDYKPKIVDAAIMKAKLIPRKEALKRVVNDKTNSRPVLVVPYHPALPNIPQIVKKHHRVMCLNPHMKSIFPEAPLVAYKRPQNIRDRLIKAKLPPPQNRPKRIKAGMHACNKPCSICPFVSNKKIIKAKHNDHKVELSKHFDCNTKNIVYIIECRKCGDQYIGQTQTLSEEDSLIILDMQGGRRYTKQLVGISTSQATNCLI